MTSDDELQKSDIKCFICETFLPDDDPVNLRYDSKLVTTGILNSIATLEVVSFIEDSFGIKIEAHEVSIENMDSIEQIATLVKSKVVDRT